VVNLSSSVRKRLVNFSEVSFVSEERKEWGRSWRRSRRDWRGWPTLLTSQLASAIFHIVRTDPEPTVYSITKKLDLHSETAVRKVLREMVGVGMVRHKMKVWYDSTPRGHKPGRVKYVYEVNEDFLVRAAKEFGDTKQEFPLIIDYLRDLKRRL